jgi:antirestriction protein ArdC
MANSSFQSARSDVYTRITDDIVAAIEQGAGEWQMPWHHDGSSIARPRNVASDKAYRGINVLALWVAAHRAGFTSGIWGTYRQWAERDCQVRRGETATTVVFWKRMGQRDDGEASDDPDPSDHHERGRRPRFLARGYYVFNKAQVDGQVQEELTCLPESERIARADAFFAALNIPIVIAGNQPCYRPDIDTIFMPPFEHFLDAPSFYSCLGHETAHGSGHPSRLDRDLTGRFGSESYAMDEVLAELTASFVLADLGIAHRRRPEHAAYISSWLKALKSDSRAIFTAAGKAQQAADWMHAQQPAAAAVPAEGTAGSLPVGDRLRICDDDRPAAQ